MAGVHAGHRERLRSRAEAVGLSSFQPHEVLELLLTQVIPQRDVNQLAHSLIDAFGSVRAVLAADEEELVRVPGIGPRAALWFKSVDGLMNAYVAEAIPPAAVVTTFSEAVAYLSRRQRPASHGFLLVSIDNAGRVTHASPLDRDRDGYPSTAQVARLALRHHARTLFTAQFPSVETDSLRGEDVDFANRLSDELGLMDLLYLDHIVRVSGGYLSAHNLRLIDKRAAPLSDARKAAESASRTRGSNRNEEPSLPGDGMDSPLPEEPDLP